MCQGMIQGRSAVAERVRGMATLEVAGVEAEAELPWVKGNNKKGCTAGRKSPGRMQGMQGLGEEGEREAPILLWEEAALALETAAGFPHNIGEYKMEDMMAHKGPGIGGLGVEVG